MPNYSDIPPTYLHQLADFLNSFSWIFEVSNTQYVIHKVLQNNSKFIKICEENIKIDEISNCLTESEKHPQELNEFIGKINSFKINFDTIRTDSWKYKNNQNKLSIKKLYEIENIGKLISEKCESDLDILVDLGSGLGYLDEFLHINFNFKVIGLEGSDKIHQKAIERQEKYYKNSSGFVQHLQHFVTINSSDFIVGQSKKILNIERDMKIGLFGLHPCGDLSVISIELFLMNDEIKTLIMSPCCYHKMSGKDEEFKEFYHFPLSKGLKEIFKR